ncbi:hypothetical protein RND81_08G044500 [Saponaria officinalis]|uniref:Uncharacterized protein n=1 Tax=Saponaria officinalis TaxID=3572 RepID=A0AAW1J3H7_SAPOF
MLDNLHLLNCLCLVLNMNFKEKIHGIHPTLNESNNTNNISNETLGRLFIVQDLMAIKANKLGNIRILCRHWWSFSNVVVKHKVMTTYIYIDHTFYRQLWYGVHILIGTILHFNFIIYKVDRLRFEKYRGASFLHNYRFLALNPTDNVLNGDVVT